MRMRRSLFLSGNMSADEDTELRDLVAQTLEANGTLGKLRVRFAVQAVSYMC